MGSMENGDSLSVDAQSSARKGGSSEGGFVASGYTRGGDAEFEARTSLRCVSAGKVVREVDPEDGPMGARPRVRRR